MRQEYSSATVTIGGRDVDALYQRLLAEAREAARRYDRANGFVDVDALDVVLAVARRPVIRDQGPPPVRRQPAPRRMPPPARRLSWLVEGRGR